MVAWLKERVVYYVVFYIVAMGIATLVLVGRYTANEEEYIANRVHEFDQRMDNFQQMQQKMIDNYYGLFLDSPEVAAIMDRAVSADEKERAILRQRLTERMAPMFASLKNFDVRLCSFHLPDQISFLRLHKPDRFGDSLRIARPSILEAQESRKKVVAFETGKLFDGFRTIYPLFHEGRFVGTAEIAYPFVALKNQAMRQRPGAYSFLIKRSIQESKSQSPVIAAYYQRSPFGETYYEDRESALFTGAKGFSTEELKTLIALNRVKIQKALGEGRLQGIVLPYGGQYALMVLKPVHELGGGQAAYMVEITPNHPFFKNEIHQMIEILILGGILLALLMWYFYRYQRSTIVLEQYKKAIDEDMIVSKTDRYGVINYVNQRFVEISGYRVDELLGRPHRLIRHPDTPSAVFEEMWETIQQGKIWHGTLQNRKKDGSSYYVNSTIFPIVDENGQILEYVGLREDITQLVESTKREEALRIQAQRSESAKMEFLANMSHEIRTPLNGIMGFAKLLSAADLPPQSRRHAQIITEQSKTLMGVINDILDLSKIESGHLSLENVQINPFLEFESAFSLFVPVAAEKEIDYYIRLDSAMEESLSIDVLRLKQVMTNLISNALKFTPAGGTIRVGIRVVSRSDTLQRLRFSVSDTGIGIAEEKLGSIFSPFVQEDGSTTRQFGGTGLGLSISSNLVGLFGGELRVQSTKGAGSRFWFEIDVPVGERTERLREKLAGRRIGITDAKAPLCASVQRQLEAFGLPFTVDDGRGMSEAEIVIAFDPASARRLASRRSGGAGEIILIDASVPSAQIRVTTIERYDHCPSQLYTVLYAQAAVPGRAAERPSPKGAGWKDKRVLVAEDYEVNRMLIDALLQTFGIAPDFAENGKIASEKIGQKGYDLVLMDINMPEMDGIEATRLIRRRYPDLPIVALTANALDGDRERFLREGMSGYLSKPINLRELGAALARFFGPDGTSDEVKEKAPPTRDEEIDPFVAAKKALQLSDEAIERLFGAFERNCGGRLDAIRSGIVAGEFGEVEREAHSIKGAAANLVLEAIAKAAGALEERCKRQEPDGYDPLLQALQSACDRFFSYRQNSR